MRNIKKWFILLAFALILTPTDLLGRVQIERAMREFQVRYHTVFNSFYTWPDCGSGSPAPAYPKDKFYGEDIADDPVLGVFLVQALREAFLSGESSGRPKLYTFFSDTDGNLEGMSSVPEYYNADDFSTIYDVEVTFENYVSVFKEIHLAIKRLEYIVEPLSNMAPEGEPGIMTKSGSSGKSSGSGCVLSVVRSGAIANYNTNSARTATDPLYFGARAYTAHSHPSGQSTCEAMATYETMWGRLYLNTDSPAGVAAPYPLGSHFKVYVAATEVGSWGDPVPHGLVFGEYRYIGGSTAPCEYYSGTFGSGSDVAAFPNVGTGVHGWQVDLGDLYPIAIVQIAWDIPVDDVDCCGCDESSFGTTDYLVNGVQVIFGLGVGSNGKKAGTMLIHEQRPSLRLFKPSGIQFNAPVTGYTFSTPLPDGSCTLNFPNGNQLKISDVSSTGYTLRFCTTGMVSALKTLNIGMGQSTNELKVVETTGATSRTNLFTYNTTNSTWTLARGQTGQIKFSSSSTWNGTNKVHTLKSMDGNTLVSQTVKTKALYPWGLELISRTRGSTNDMTPLTEAWTYYSDPSDTNNYGRLATYTDENGRWERYEYNTNGLVSKIIEQIGSASISAAESASKVTTRTYTANSTNAPTVMEVVTWRGNEIARRYTIWNGSIREDIVCQIAGASSTDSANLVTRTKYMTDGAGAQIYPPKIEYVLYPNNTLEMYSYTTNGVGEVTETVNLGEANASGTGFSNSTGTITVTVKSGLGQVISNTVRDRSNTNIVLSSQVNEFDILGRVCKTTYLDGTSTTQSNVYCGIKWEKSREGVVTYYDYDNMRRLVKTTVNNVCTTNILDADGNVLVSMRFPTNNYAGRLTNFMASYDTAGRMTFETNAVGTVTAYDRYLQGAFCFENVIEGYGSTSTITNQTRYYKDGTSHSTWRNGVQLTGYLYGVSQSGTNSFGINPTEYYTHLNQYSGYGTVPERTFFDMVGRSHKTMFTSSSVFVADYYNSKGQRIRSRDADGNQMLYQYNGLGELEYTAVDMNLDGNINLAETDRVTRQVRSVTTNDVTSIVRQETYRWATNGTNSSTKVSTLDTSTDGLTSWQMLWNGSASVTNKTVTEYPATGAITRRVTVTKPDGTRTVSEYESGRLARVMEKGINSAILTQTSYGYDDYGRQNTITDSRNGTTTLTFDAADRVVTVTTPSPGAGQNAQVTAHYYDALGRETGLKYPDNTYLTNIYDSNGFLILTKGSRQYPVGYSYDRQGRVTTMTNWTSYPSTGANVTTWNYSPNRGFLTSKVYADSNRVDYTYTLGGKVATRQWARTGPGSSRITTTYSYNKAGEPYLVTYSDGTSTLTNTYNRLGQLTGVANNGIATTLSYNGAGQLTGESYAGGTLTGRSVSKTYDAKLRLSQVRAPNLVTNAFAYSGASGRLATVTHGAYSANYGYTTNSSLVSQVLFKQGSDTRMTTTKSYDKLNRLTGMVSTPSGGGQLPFSYGASYNEANQRITVTMNDGSYWVYEYDTLGQIKAAKKHFADGTFVPGQQFTYSHSNIGNRTSSTIGGTETGGSSGINTYQTLTNKANQYVRKYGALGYNILGTAHPGSNVVVNGSSVNYRRGEYFWKWMSVTSSTSPRWLPVEVASGSQTNGNIFMPGRPEYFTYDLDGNMLSDGRWNYTWDAENRLTSMTDNTTCTNDVPKRIVFEYDYQGRRIAKKVWNNTAGTNDPIVNLKYLYDGWNLIAELDGNNSLVRSYTWGVDASGSMQGAGGVGGLLMVNAGTNGVHFSAYDLNGNVMGLVNATNGIISAKYEYGPFGEVFCSVGDMAKVNPFGFSTKYTDSETDFVYYGYRYYSPALGRWLSRDPIEEQGGLNLYAFVNNDPVNKWDKLGLYRPKICGVGCNYNYNTSVNNVYGSFQKTRCCGDKIYNIDEKCCRNKVLWSKKERIQTGVFVCRGKAHIMPIVNHVWLETPDGPIDVVGGLMIFYSTGLVGQADLYVGKKKDCSEVLLSPCECNRPVENIREDFIEIVHAVRKMWLNGDLEWTYTVCGAHCAHFVNEVLLSSTDALGCSGFSLGPSNFYKDNTAPIDYNMSF